MDSLVDVPTAFVEMAHRIVWCSVATVDPQNRPRTRVLHPFWEFDGTSLVGWVASGQTEVKAAGLAHTPFVSCTYWDPSHDTCTADARAIWQIDADTRSRIWNLFKTTAPPLGYDPAIIPGWDSPESPGFTVLRLEPWRLRVFPGSALMGGGSAALNWRSEDPSTAG